MSSDYPYDALCQCFQCCFDGIFCCCTDQTQETSWCVCKFLFAEELRDMLDRCMCDCLCGGCAFICYSCSFCLPDREKASVNIVDKNDIIVMTITDIEWRRGLKADFFYDAVASSPLAGQAMKQSECTRFE